MNLLSADEQRLNEIRYLIENRESYALIEAKAHALDGLTNIQKFPCIYAGLLLARHLRIADAMAMLHHAQDHAIIRFVIEFLEAHKSLTPAAQLFQDPQIYNVHNQTPLYKEFLSNTLLAIQQFACANPPPQGDSACIVDIGPGNGYLLVKIINALLEKYPLKNLTLILLEPSQNMLDCCVPYCRENIKIPIQFDLICAKMESLPCEEKLRVLTKRPIWFVNAAASLHHIPGETKGMVLKVLKEMSTQLLLSEFHGNLDRPDRDTPELIYAAFIHIAHSFESVLANQTIPAWQRLALLRQYYLIEFLNIVAKPRLERLDFIAPDASWQKLIESIGGTVERKFDTVRKGQQLITFTMDVRF